MDPRLMGAFVDAWLILGAPLGVGSAAWLILTKGDAYAQAIGLVLGWLIAGDILCAATVPLGLLAMAPASVILGWLWAVICTVPYGSPRTVYDAALKASWRFAGRRVRAFMARRPAHPDGHRDP
jgi:hypothetical protein